MTRVRTARIAVCVGLLYLFTLSGCGPQGGGEDRATEATAPETGGEMARTNRHDEWSDFVNRYIERHFEFNPTAAVRAGRHEYDGRLPDWTAAGMAAYVDWLDDQRRQALAFADDVLPAADRFQRDYLVSEIDDDLFWIRTADCKLMIGTLRDEWTATRGGRQAWKAFHDEFLSYGGPPIPMVRRAMLGDDHTNPLMRVPGQAGGQTLH